MQRLGLNKGGYLGERIDIGAVLSEIDRLADATGWTSEVFLDWSLEPDSAERNPLRDPFRLKAYTRRVPDSKGRIYISAGIHGDEPAGPLAIRELVRQNIWPAQLEICAIPCLNPTGFQRGTRENDQNADLNRDYRQCVTAEVKAHTAWLGTQPGFDLALLLHEDWESNGFYVYEMNPNHRPSIAQIMIDAVRPICPIEMALLVDNWDCKGGIISPKVNPEERPQWPEAIYLLKTKSRQNYTLEAPSDYPMEIRVASLCAAVKAALSRFQADSSE